MTKKSKKSLPYSEKRLYRLRAQGEIWIQSYMESASSALVGRQIRAVKFNSRRKPPSGKIVPLSEMHSMTLTLDDGSEVIVTPSFGGGGKFRPHVPKSYGGLHVMKISSQNV
jgi:hypothetical protein